MYFEIPGNIRDFTDTLILARLEAEEDPNEADLDKLTDTHIVQTLSDIFFGKVRERERERERETH